MPWLFGNISPLREPEDLWSVQLSTAYFGSFVRSGQPNPDEGFLEVRGYGKVLEAVRETGRWEKVRDEKGPMRLLDWPAVERDFIDVEQCAWLNYTLGYYLEGGA